MVEEKLVDEILEHPLNNLIKNSYLPNALNGSGENH